MKDFGALGFDGGGTRSRAVLVSPQGEIIGTGLVGPANVKRNGLENSIKALEEAFALAWKDSGLKKRPADAAFLGCAGVSSQKDRDRFKQAVVEAGISSPNKVWVDHDLRIALAGALGGAPGIVIVAGTGSAAYGRTNDGCAWQAGGWGWKIDDFGSGYWLGQQALKAAAHEVDGRGKPTSLSQSILEQLGIKSIGDLTENLYGPNQIGVHEIAQLARIVIREAEMGDGVAGEIAEEGFAELARMTLAVAQKLDWEKETVKVSAIGGVARSGDYFTSTLKSKLNTVLPGAILNPPILPPVLGAAFLALQKSEAKTVEHFMLKLQGNPKADDLW